MARRIHDRVEVPAGQGVLGDQSQL